MGLSELQALVMTRQSCIQDLGDRTALTVLMQPTPRVLWHPGYDMRQPVPGYFCPSLHRRPISEKKWYNDSSATRSWREITDLRYTRVRGSEFESQCCLPTAGHMCRSVLQTLRKRSANCHSNYSLVLVGSLLRLSMCDLNNKRVMAPLTHYAGSSQDNSVEVSSGM